MTTSTLPPQTVQRPSAVQARIDAALRDLPSDYAPRTRHYNGAEHVAQGEHAHPVEVRQSAIETKESLMSRGVKSIAKQGGAGPDWREQK